MGEEERRRRNPDRHLAEDRVPGRLIVGVLAFTLVWMGGGVLWAALLLRAHERQGGRPERTRIAPSRVSAPPPPDVFVGQIERGYGKGEVLRVRQLSRLDEYAWVDRAHGDAAIPIGEAMAVIAANPRFDVRTEPASETAAAAARAAVEADEKLRREWWERVRHEAPFGPPTLAPTATAGVVGPTPEVPGGQER
ncbi:MAG TPA: hypothetical protein VHF22_15280 [Planctomycetota bacterium]|nr:hypothetical protein [Planctomycetota bacterium]